MAVISHGCVRCGGDLFWERDERGAPELRCLQCGRVPGSEVTEQVSLLERCPKCGLWRRVGSMAQHVAGCRRKGHVAKGGDIVLNERGAAYKAAYLREREGKAV